jgi:hypothetical protein
VVITSRYKDGPESVDDAGWGRSCESWMERWLLRRRMKVRRGREKERRKCV